MVKVCSFGDRVAAAICALEVKRLGEEKDLGDYVGVSGEDADISM